MYIDNITIQAGKFPVNDIYPFNVPTLCGTQQIRMNKAVTFFVGENGSGKSTLLQAVSRKCNIHIWKETERSRYRYNKYEEEFFRYIDLAPNNQTMVGAFFSADIFRHFTQNLDEWASSDPGVLNYFGGASLYTQSHGQSLMSFFRTRYAIQGLYLLDEPETALSPKHLLELVTILRDMGNAGHAQFIIATHSPILLACPGAEIFSFDSVPIHQCRYEDTEYFRVYRDFMNNREKYV